ncbi:MAG: hypothetical protein J5585_11185 [Clostridia bacterium]|nr:hypothetical protein [Clostridia bacterium]
MKKIITLIIIAAMALSALSACAEAPGAGTQTGGPSAADPSQTAATGEPSLTEPAQTTGASTEPTETEPAETEAATSAEQTTAEPGPEPSGGVLSRFDEFDLKLAEFVERTQTGNYVISPLSFKYALGMLIAGAEGNTLKQFTEGLGLKDLSEFENYVKSFNSFEEGFNSKIARDLTEYDERIKSGANPDFLKKPGGALHVADSVWKRSDLDDFKSEYKLRLEMYNARYDSFFGSDIIKKVNDWANEKTEGMIPKVLPDDYDTEGLAVVLANALYYKNGWRNEFFEIGERDFRTSGGEKVKKNFIESEEYYAYYEDADTRLVVVPMDNGVNMVFVIGSTSGLSEKIAQAKTKNVMVIIPEFTTETSLDNYELKGFLGSLGITDVFEAGKADLSGMIEGKDDLYVSDIIQKAKIKLDKTGVEAAAVTVISVKDTAVPADPVVFKADEPFRFYITTGESGWTNDSGVVLFEGRISE